MSSIRSARQRKASARGGDVPVRETVAKRKRALHCWRPAIASGATPALHAELADELGVEVGLERLDAALRAVARVLHAAERHFRQGEAMVVDRHHAAFEGRADRRHGLGVLGVGVGGQAPGEAVGFLHHAVEILERRDRRQRAERLVVHDLGVERHVGHDGRLVEVALVALALAAGLDLGALGDGIADERVHGVQAALGDERAHAGVGFEAVADLHVLGVGGEALDELRIDLLVHQEAGRRDADLAGVAELVGAQDVHRLLEVGILEHDGRRMAAQLHGDALHVRAGQRRELLADRCRARERHLPDDRMRDQVLADLRRHAVDQLDHAGRHAGIDEGLDQLGARAGRILRSLDDDRAAGGERRRGLAHHLVDREVPRREGRDRTDRLLDDELVHVLGARRHDAAVGAAAFLGHPVDDVGGEVGLDLGLEQAACPAPWS